ncbi:hypothetical protein Pmi06nite_82230 [Planotetraspora mira]|uniref:Uncharacterized protein n=1 Tax=Planotetraspora mira TaxID=58121 RepID=A0A8J3TYB5_9ACTN|nr:hypothetical protein Pmi06nite_82230 [Planotetraspora mira]
MSMLPTMKKDGAQTRTRSTHIAKNEPREAHLEAALANRSNADRWRLTSDGIVGVEPSAMDAEADDLSRWDLHGW